ncbi:MAG: DEAD/DEAH box helicase [candidate division NC10 bacterium]|nr:DEAD/DEAH box helicase [candidate division NC10 bacterium]
MQVQEQLERRRKRALEEIVRVTHRGGHPVFSTFEVTSISGRRYRVQIRSLTELRNSCVCPDYRTNLLGTCKHIEGVLLYLKKKYGRRWAGFEAEGPPATQIYLHYAEDITVRVSLPRRGAVRDLLTRYVDPEGVLQGRVDHVLSALLEEIEKLPPPQRAMLQIAEEVREYLDRLQDLEAIEQQKAWFLEQVEKGTRSLQVIGTRLYPYQEKGALHLAFGRRTMLADDMGLGKTVEAIAASALLHELRDIQKVLIICPASLKHQWAREIRKFTTFPVTVVQGQSPQRRLLYEQPSFFTIMNYELVLRDQAQLERLRPDVIILDEAQRIKNWRTKTANEVKRLQSRYAFVLTGTPLENRLDELYSIFQFLDPRILGPLWQFNERYFELETLKSGAVKVLGYKNLDELRSRIGPYVLRRTRQEVLTELPERVDNNFFVELTPPQRAAYEEYRQIVAQLMSIAQRRPLTPREQDRLLKSLIKMRLICNALALHDHTIPPKERERTAPKLGELSTILDDEVANNGHKALVFSQWAGMLELTEPIMKRLDLGYVKLTGSVPSARRGGLIDRFFSDEACRVFLSTDAGGLGLNLQAASLVVNLDLPWNPAVLEQRIGRVHRHGQPRAVHVINLIAQDTIEERILDTLATKRSIFAGIFGSEESPTSIHFRDIGQTLLQRLSELMEKPAPMREREVKVEEEAEPREAIHVPRPAPTVRSFADLLVARFPGRILLVRRAPQLPGVASDGNLLLVVDREPATLRPEIESLLKEHFGPDQPIPGLHLLEPEGYRTLTALTGGLVERSRQEEEAYRAPALPAPTVTPEREEAERLLKKAREAFQFAEKRLKLAEVILGGGFPEEALRPIRESLGWALSAHLLLVKDREPGPDLPSPREVQAELLESGRVPEELGARLARVRELTEPQEGDQGPPPPSAKTVETMLTAVRQLIELGHQRVVHEGL